MNPMDEPEQRKAYMEGLKPTAEKIMEQLRQERRSESQPKRKGIIIGVSGPSDGMQAVDNIDA